MDIKIMARYVPLRSELLTEVKKSKRTTDSRHSLPVAENVLTRDFKAPRPNEVWTCGHHLRLDCGRVALPDRLS